MATVSKASFGQLRILALVVAAIVVLAGCGEDGNGGNGGADQPSPQTNSLSEMVQKMSAARSTVQRDAAAIKANYAGGTLCNLPQEQARRIYDTAAQRYNSVADAFNSWIDGYNAALAAGESVGPGTRFAADLQAAVSRGDMFHNWANSEEGCGVGGANAAPGGAVKAVAAVLGELIPVLTEAGIDIAEEYRQSNEERRQAISETLLAQKWVSFNDVPYP